MAPVAWPHLGRTIRQADYRTTVPNCNEVETAGFAAF